jgi:hypothetical protein
MASDSAQHQAGRASSRDVDMHGVRVRAEVVVVRVAVAVVEAPFSENCCGVPEYNIAAGRGCWTGVSLSRARGV